MIVSEGENKYEDFEIQYGEQKNFEIVGKIGRGKYSEVFEGFDLRTERKVCLKILKPVKISKIKREVKVLSDLAGGPNIIGFLDVVQEPKSEVNTIITEFVGGSHIGEILSKDLNPKQIKAFSYQILRAIEYSHSKGIMHRDIKPSNIMLSDDYSTLRILDWGLAEFYRPGAEYNCRVASRYYKAPELLVGNKNYDYSVDMWGFACTLASMLFKRIPFFQGRDNYDQLVKIAKRLGTKELYDYLEKWDIQLGSHYDGLLTRNKYKKKDLHIYKNQENEGNLCEDGIDLLRKLFVYDHEKRLTSKDALLHPYFCK